MDNGKYKKRLRQNDDIDESQHFLILCMSGYILITCMWWGYILTNKL